MPKKTTITRINRTLDRELKQYFGEIPRPALLDLMYKTSALRAEAWTKKPNKTLTSILKKK